MLVIPALWGRGRKIRKSDLSFAMGQTLSQSKTKACVCRHAFSSACAGFSALLYDLRYILSKVLVFLKQGLMSFRLTSNQVFLPGLSSAGVSMFPPCWAYLFFTLYLQCLYGHGACPRVKRQHLWSWFSFYPQGGVQRLSGVQACMESAFNIEPFCWPILLTF